MVTTLAAVEALLQYYDLPFPNEARGKISETVIAANLAADIEPVDSGYRVTVRRLPQGKTQEAAWRLAAETRMYQIIEQEGALGCGSGTKGYLCRLRDDPQRHKFQII
jgi:hypothetical protein